MVLLCSVIFSLSKNIRFCCGRKMHDTLFTKLMALPFLFHEFQNRFIAGLGYNGSQAKTHQIGA